MRLDRKLFRSVQRDLRDPCRKCAVQLDQMDADEAQFAPHIFDPDKYRIFSQLKREAKTDVLASPPYAALDSTDAEIDGLGDT
jgi:hypothetical protein